MGNDGGSIPDRRDLVRTKAKAEQADRNNQTKARWGFCALSKKRLQQPVVACRLGRLYNKDALIEFLLDPTTYGDGKTICGHVRSLKDVKELKLTPNPNRPSSSSEGDSAAALFVCPLTLKEMNGGLPFVYLLTCGDVFSQAGLKAMATSPPAADKDEKETHQGEMSLCPQCNTKYDPREDVFAINPSPEEEERMIERMAIYLASKPIKSKKRKVAALKEEEEESKAKRRVIVPDTPRTPMMSAGMERRAARVVEGATEIHKTKVEKMSDAVKSLYRNKDQEKGAKPNWISQGTFTRYA